MQQNILLLGGLGGVGRQVLQDVLAYTPARITVAGRRPCPPDFSTDSGQRQRYRSLDVTDGEALSSAIAAHDLVIHTAGPFRYRDTRVLEACIQRGVDYLDVADNPDYVTQALALCDRACAAGITAVVSTGVFPGISNSMVRQGVELLETATAIHLSYVVSGSGGAGVTVMRTTFLELQEPISAWIGGHRQSLAPYSQRQRVVFPAPYGRCAVYWFNTVEALTLPQSFPVQTVTTKFGSLPDMYNHLTWLTAHGIPKSWLRRPSVVEFLAQVSYRMTEVSDRLSGTGLAMRADVVGELRGQATTATVTYTHPDTAQAAGLGAGSVAQLMLAGELHKPGVWPVEQGLSTPQFLKTLAQRGGATEVTLAPATGEVNPPP